MNQLTKARGWHLAIEFLAVEIPRRARQIVACGPEPHHPSRRDSGSPRAQRLGQNDLPEDDQPSHRADGRQKFVCKTSRSGSGTRSVCGEAHRIRHSGRRSFPALQRKRDNVALVPRLENWDPSKVEARAWKRFCDLSACPSPNSPTGIHINCREANASVLDFGAGACRRAADPVDGRAIWSARSHNARRTTDSEFKNLQQQLRKTIVFVTHDVGEALLLGNRIGLMESGMLRGVYRPEEFLQSDDASVKLYVDVFRKGQQMFRN